MIISITGVAGVGKTSIAKKLARLLNAKVIHLSRFTKKVSCGYDEILKTNIVDIKKLKKVINNEIRKHAKTKENVIVEGLLSHYIDTDIIILLRLSPKEIEKRLKKRKYLKIKIKENIMAEILDQIYVECLENAKNKKIKIVQIDTTGRTIDQITKRIFNILRRKNYKKVRKINGIEVLGDDIDWLEKYEKYIIEIER
jgi:adenylate kinase